MLPHGFLGYTHGPQLGGSGNFGKQNLAGKSSQWHHIVTALFDPGPFLDLIDVFLFCVYDENLPHHMVLLPGCAVLLRSTNHNNHEVNPPEPWAKFNVSSSGHSARCFLTAQPVSYVSGPWHRSSWLWPLALCFLKNLLSWDFGSLVLFLNSLLRMPASSKQHTPALSPFRSGLFSQPVPNSVTT